MNDPYSDAELDALLASARAQRPDTARAEFAFETRLLARLREVRSTESVWAMVTWRLVPVFAACLVALTIWQSQVVSEANDAAAFANTENSGTMEMSSLLD